MCKKPKEKGGNALGLGIWKRVTVPRPWEGERDSCLRASEEEKASRLIGLVGLGAFLVLEVTWCAVMCHRHFRSRGRPYSKSRIQMGSMLFHIPVS